MAVTFESHTLANGLKLVTLPVESEMFHFEVGVPFGMDDELEPHMYESAHALEHMVAKFTSAKYPSSIHNSELLDSLGVSKNAYTTPQCTGYYINGLSDAFPTAFDVVMHALAAFTLDESVFANEMNAVINELRAHITDTWYDFNTVYHSHLFAGSARAKTTQQRLDNVKSLTPVQLMQIYQDRYEARLMTAIYVGPRHHISALSAHMSLIKNSNTLNSVRRQLPSPTLGVTLTVPQKLRNDAGRIQCSFRVNKPWTPRLQAVATCISTTLTQGFSSRLYKMLRTTKGLVYAVQSRVDFEIAQPEFSWFHITAKCSASSIQQVWECIRQELMLLAMAGPTSCEMRKWRNQRRTVLANLAYASPKDVVKQCGWVIHQGSEPMTPRRIAEEALKLSQEEIQAFAQQFLTVNNCIVIHNGKTPPASAPDSKKTSDSGGFM